MKSISKFIEIIVQLRNFTLFWLGQSLSEVGTRLTGFGLGIWVYQSTHAVTQLSIVLFLTSLPGVVITPFVGALVDRWNRKWIIFCSDFAAAIVTLVLALLLMTHNLQPWHTYISAFFTSVCGSFQMTAKSAALPLMVPRHQLGRANGLIHFSTALGQLTAPVLAGVLIAKLQLQGLLLIDFSSYIIALTALMFIQIPQLESRVISGRGITSIINDIIYGWESISSQLFLIILLAFMTIHFFVDGMTNVLISPLILSFASTTTFGNIMSIAGSGMVAGSIFMSIWGGGKKSLSALFVFAFLNGIGLVLAGIKPSIVTITVGISLSYFTLPIILGISSTIWQTRLNPSVQGRVFSLFGAITGLGLACGNISASPLADGIMEPMLSSGGLLANSIGRLIETGQGRGIGFLLVIEGLLILITSLILQNYFYLQQFDEKFLTSGREELRDSRLGQNSESAGFDRELHSRQQ